MVLKVSDFLAKLVSHYLEIGDCVWSFKNAKDTGASWRVGSSGVDDLKNHLEGTTTFISPYLQPDLITGNSSLVPKKGVAPFYLISVMLTLGTRRG